MKNGKFKLIEAFHFMLVPLLLTKCEPDAGFSNRSASQDYSDAIQLAVGNFWVFEVTITNYATGETVKLEDEVIEIIDTLRRAQSKVFVMVGPNYRWERSVIDSAGYLLDFYTREVLFSGVKLEETIYENDEVCVSMTNVDSVICVPAGTFKTINYKRASKLSNESTNHFYANGIGLVKQLYTSQEFKEEHNLIRFNIVEE